MEAEQHCLTALFVQTPAREARRPEGRVATAVDTSDAAIKVHAKDLKSCGMQG